MLAQGVNFTIVDVRTPEEYKSGHIPGAINIPIYELPTRLNELQNRKLLIYCKSGVRSQTAARILIVNGIQDVWCLVGGLDAWIAAGYPVE
jgi:rhodanese-related sulfurtransferase